MEHDHGLTGDLQAYATHRSSVRLVHEFAHSGFFTGAHFEYYGVNDDHAIRTDDVVATTMLSVRIGLKTSRGGGIEPKSLIRLEERREDVDLLLRQIPAELPLHALSAEQFEEHLGTSSPATRLYELLRDEVGLPWVATHKLLARKRPYLLPIKDGVLKQALMPRADEWWRPWWMTFSRPPDLVAQLEELGAAADAGTRSPLRVADVAVWMWHRGADQVPGLRETVGSFAPAAGE